MDFFVILTLLAWSTTCYCFGRHAGFFDGMDAGKKIYSQDKE